MSNRCRPCPICVVRPRESDCIGPLEVNFGNREGLERDRYDLTYCECGGLIYISPAPSDADIRSMYARSEQFGDVANRSSNPYRGEQAIAVLEYITGRLIAILRWARIDTGERLKVLEVGAGLGWMCRAAKIVSWDNLTVAQDLTSEAVDECRWVDHYLVEDLMTARSADTHGPFDVISLTHVFEHLVDPVAMLRRLGGLLSERGVLFITAPRRPVDWTRETDIELWRSWSYNHTPAHIQYFTRSSFEKAAAAAGLTVAFWDASHEDGQAFEGWLRLQRV